MRNKSIEHGIFLIKVIQKEYPAKTPKNTISKLDMVRIFSETIRLGTTSFQNIINILKSHGVVETTFYTEITINQFALNKFYSKFPDESKEAEKRFKEWAK